MGQQAASEQRPSLLRDTFVYVFSQIATKAMGVLLLPIITTLLSAAEYGIIDLLSLLIYLGIELAVLGMDYIFALHYHDKGQDQRRLIGSFFSGRMVLSSFLCGVGLLSAPWLAAWLATPEAVGGVRIIALTLPATVLLNSWLVVLRQQGRSRTIAFWSIMRIALVASSTIGLLWLWPAHPFEAYFTGSLVVDIGLATALTVRMRRWWGRPDWALFLRLSRRGLMFFPRSIYFLAITLIGRQILLHTATATELGYYAAASKLSFGISIVISAVNQAWLPYSMSIAHETHAGMRYARYLSQYVIIAGSAGVLIGVFAPEVLWLLTQPDYVNAAPAVGWLTISLIAIGANSIVTTGLNITKQTDSIGYVTMAMGIVNLGLMVVFIPKLGSLGLALATALDQVVGTCILYWYAQRRYPISYDQRRLGLWLAGMLLVQTAMTLLHPTTGWAALGSHLLLALAWMALITLSGGWKLLDLGTLLNRVRQRRRPVPERP